VTLDDGNLLWLKSRTLATKARSLSETLDALVTAARSDTGAAAGAARSVVGTVDIAADDPGLDHADVYMEQLFESSLTRPVMARETPPPYGSRPKSRNKRRG